MILFFCNYFGISLGYGNKLCWSVKSSIKLSESMQCKTKINKKLLLRIILEIIDI